MDDDECLGGDICSPEERLCRSARLTTLTDPTACGKTVLVYRHFVVGFHTSTVLKNGVWPMRICCTSRNSCYRLSGVCHITQVVLWWSETIISTVVSAGGVVRSRRKKSTTFASPSMRQLHQSQRLMLQHGLCHTAACHASIIASKSSP